MNRNLNFLLIAITVCFFAGSSMAAPKEHNEGANSQFIDDLAREMYLNKVLYSMNIHLSQKYCFSFRHLFYNQELSRLEIYLIEKSECEYKLKFKDKKDFYEELAIKVGVRPFPRLGVIIGFLKSAQTPMSSGGNRVLESSLSGMLENPVLISVSISDTDKITRVITKANYLKLKSKSFLALDDFCSDLSNIPCNKENDKGADYDILERL